MSENVTIVLIVIVGIVFVLVCALWMFRNRLDKFSFSASKKRITANLEGHQEAGINISSNTQLGDENEIEIDVRRDNVIVKENLIKGNRNKINVNDKASKSDNDSRTG